MCRIINESLLGAKWRFVVILVWFWALLADKRGPLNDNQQVQTSTFFAVEDWEIYSTQPQSYWLSFHKSAQDFEVWTHIKIYSPSVTPNSYICIGTSEVVQKSKAKSSFSTMLGIGLTSYTCVQYENPVILDQSLYYFKYSTFFILLSPWTAI